jgi:anti-sigma factor RsiW
VADGRWRITVVPPDWGQDHLSSEAVVAFVDGELAPGPHSRAIQHLGQCHECASQVRAQGQARSALRAAAGPCMPSALLSSLRSIPQEADLPAPPAGLAMTADGRLVSVVRPERAGPGIAGVAAPDALAASEHDIRTSTQRRMRLGTSVAASGLALGALTFGVPASSTVPPAPAPAAQRSTLGAAPNIVDARFRLNPSSPATTGSAPAAHPGTPRSARLR